MFEIQCDLVEAVFGDLKIENEFPDSFLLCGLYPFITMMKTSNSRCACDLLKSETPDRYPKQV